MCQLRAGQISAVEWILLPSHQMLYLTVDPGPLWVGLRWGAPRWEKGQGRQRDESSRAANRISMCLAPLLLLEAIRSRSVAMSMNLRGRTFEKISNSLSPLSQK